MALKSLGAAGEASGPIFRQADPVVRKARDLAKSGVSPTNELARLLTNLQQTKGWDGLVELIYNTAGALNGFDQYGHFGRGHVALTTCLEYIPGAAGTSGCDANFNGVNAAQGAEDSGAALLRLLLKEQTKRTGGTSAGFEPSTGVGQAGAVGAEAELGEASSAEGTEPLLDYLLGP